MDEIPVADMKVGTISTIPFESNFPIDDDRCRGQNRGKDNGWCR